MHALLMSAGRRLNVTDARPAPAYGTAQSAQTRPGDEMSQYYDSDSNIAAELVFDDAHRRATFNDQVEIIE